MVIDITLEEAKTLCMIFRNIGGDPYKSPRSYIDQLWDKIIEAYPDLADFGSGLDDYIQGSIYFNDFKEEIVTKRFPF